MKTIYFAHGFVDYGNHREATALEALRNTFRGYKVINPADLEEEYLAWKANNPDLADNDPIRYFREIARECDGVVYMVNNDATVDPDVATEALEALVHGKPVYRVRVLGGYANVKPINNHFDEFIQTIDEARRKIRAVKG